MLLRSVFIVFVILMILNVFSCKEEEKELEPGYILQKWSNAIEKYDYKNYIKCEAYPKSEAVFKEIYKDDYFVDLMVIDAGDPNNKNIQKDYQGNPFISCIVNFEGTAVKRSNRKPYQIIRGDMVFVKFLNGDRSKDGWLISNRTITRINK